ncbi:S41 family peptidase [Aquimarina sp. 2201CG1-2-11]|uniref:S41 family peptidase n=1 Tax=Aquimarina discodermiae TaxID=3231043 RepID=UPI0034629B1F
MKSIVFCIFFIGFTVLGQTKYQKDFEYLWNTVDTYFAYFDTQKVNWDKVKMIYQPRVDNVKNNAEFIKVLEQITRELHNGHVGLNTNLPSSHRLIPTGTDLWVGYKDHEFIVSAIREGSLSETLEIKLGDRITGINQRPINEVVKEYLPKSTKKYSDRMYEFIANMLIAGTHDTKRLITVNDSLTLNLEAFKNKESESYIETKLLTDAIGYIKFNNSLGEEDMILAFDKAINDMNTTDGLILDFRETPSGGNSIVARAIMSRFIKKERPYQRHSFPFEEKLYGIERNTIELVSPREKTYTKPLVVLCGKWTGSMGEGIVIGLDAMDRALIVGTEMAGLLGAIYSYTLPETEIGFQIPVEKLFHINGTPREGFRPKHYILDTAKQLKKAIQLILKNTNKGFDTQ